MILFEYAADHLRLSALLNHARSSRVLQQSGPNQEVTPLPGIYFFDGWRAPSDPACRSQRTYPNRGTHPNVMFSAQEATATNTESSQTPDEEARDIFILAKGSPEPSRGWTQHFQRPRHAQKATTNPSNTEGQPQELPTCSPQLTSELLHCLSTLPDPWPLAKITINWTQQAEWVSKNGKTFATTCVHVEVLLIFCFLSGKDRALERDRPYWRGKKKSMY